MPHFDAEGNDTWICQGCASIFSSKTIPIWVEKKGNHCPKCLHEIGKPKLVLHVGKVVKRESSLKHNLIDFFGATEVSEFFFD